MNPLISILIRHKEGRDKELERCMSSINSQTYRNHISIVHADSSKSFQNAKNESIRMNEDKTKYISKSFAVSSNSMHYEWIKTHYNLYCNYLKKCVTGGWFFFMDDDDYLASPTVLEELSKHLFEGALIVQFLRKNNRNIKGHDVIKPTDRMIEKGIIKKGVIGGGCLCLHHSFKDVADWGGYKAADYDWIKAVTDKIPTKFVKLVLQISEKANLGK